MPNKLTDTDVKKALECAIRNDCDCNCVFLLPNKVQDALDLINRLQAENETLRDVVKQNHLIRNNGKSPLSLIKAEAYKEFAEEVNKELFGEEYQLDKVHRRAVERILNRLTSKE